MNNLFLITLFLFTCFYACNNSPSFKETGPVYGPIYKAAPYNFGTITADKNGISFTGNTFYRNHDEYCEGCYSINVYTFEDSVHLNELLLISNLHITKLGLYELFPDDPSNNTLGHGIGLGKNTEVSYYTYLEIGDVEGDTYELYEDLPNWLEILSVDTLAGIITGNFELHFVKIIENDLRNPKYVRFSNVEFELRIN